MTHIKLDRFHVSHHQGMRLILGVPRSTSAKMMRHKLQMIPVEHRAKLGRATPFRTIIGNTNHPLHSKINSRQRNVWTTEIQECHRFASEHLYEPTQLQIDYAAPWAPLPYECRTDKTQEGRKY